MKEKFDLVWEKVFSLLAQIGGTCHLENAGATGIWERNVPPFLPCLSLSGLTGLWRPGWPSGVACQRPQASADSGLLKKEEDLSRNE